MKTPVVILFGVLLFAACKDNKVLPEASQVETNDSEGVYQIPSAYWYSFDLFSGNVIYIGSLTITDQKPNDIDGITSSYRFIITEIITSSPEVVPAYGVGDVIESETFRKIVNGARHALCFSRYPEGKDGETVIDGGFPLYFDDDVTHAIHLIRTEGFDPEKYSEEDYMSIKGLLRFPEMHDYNREKTKN